MKKIMIRTLLAIGLFITTSTLLAQGPPEPPENPGDGGGPVGGGAPIGSGVGILMVLGAAYGGHKLYKAFRQQEQELEE